MGDYNVFLLVLPLSLAQGVSELTPSILKWVYMATEIGPLFVPIVSYGLIVAGAFMFIYIFVSAAYKNMAIVSDPIEILEMGRRTLRSASLVSHHRIQRDSYILLNNNHTGNSENNDDDS